MLRRKLTREEVARRNWFLLTLGIVTKTIGFDLVPVSPMDLTKNEFSVIAKPKTDDKKTSNPE